MHELASLFAALGRSRFRSNFKLNARDQAYLQSKGLPLIMDHARDFISQRLAPADLPNDGKQTPMRGHPVFVAQHATACCCRSCLQKWHQIPPGRALNAQEQEYILQVLAHWLQARY